MKIILCLFVFCAAVSQISAARLKITIFYETLCGSCFNFFREQLWPAYQDNFIRDNVYIELVPFGKANYTENPWNITCQHGPNECLGNVRQACFLARHTINSQQVAFASCCMAENNPPTAGEKCAQKLNLNYNGVEECANNNEGIKLQIIHGKRTHEFQPKITWVPTIVYDDVYDAQDQKESQKNFKKVVLRKLQGTN